MKASKSEVTYFILSIILIAFAGGIYLFFGNTKTNTSSSQPKSSISSSSSSQADLEAKAQELLSAAQANPSAEAVTNAQAAINKISDEAKKTDFQSQLDAVSAEVTNQTNAENAVKTAEDNQTSDNVAAAQAAIDVLTNQATKDQLQARLDAVSNAIAANTAQSTEQDTAASSNATVDQNNTSRTPSSVTTDGTYTYYSY
ncbi:peptidase [Streptococcus ruminicola]|uniref:Peptidase n=1 Tax=Streptococcus ruminicola TaxID=2686210 RepID=A0AAE6R305_9STRE|nr:peptidase [Streptococcus ruminicola]QGZ26751.1 peptidase [Streptococcus ruminicola]WFM81380.1 peptidase [Streptococcus ruminicola]